MCLRLGYLTWSPDAFGYDLTTVGNQEAERLFALPSVLFRQFDSAALLFTEFGGSYGE